MDAIRTRLVPISAAAEASSALSRLQQKQASEEKTEQVVFGAARALGGTVSDACRFMQTYGLYDIHRSADKTDASFQTYIYSYESPFVFVNASGTTEDYTTFPHEFGHFTDSYYNYGANEDLETAETYSQAMEYLALCCTDALSERERESLLKLKLTDTLDTFVTQAAFSSFEQQVYALPEDRLTLDAVNAVYLQVCRDFGFYETGLDFYYSQSWIDILHFFEAPDYVISYCVSAETSLQLYRLEAEQDGEGQAAYFRLLDRDLNAGVQKVMEDAGLANPFREDAMDQTAALFRRQLGLRAG